MVARITPMRIGREVADRYSSLKQEEPMPQTQFIPSPLKIIERRRCQNCGARMMMTGIEPMGLGTDRRTFECDQCGHEEELLVKF